MARDEVLAAWQAAGTDLTMLPSGMEVRLEPVPIAEMIRTGFLPSQLRLVALKFASPEGVTPDEMATEEQKHWEHLQRLMISRWLSAVQWTCPCAECAARRSVPIEERSYHLDPEALAADPPPIPRIDLVALADMVCYLRTPKQVDALSRVAHGQMEPEAAGRIVEAERIHTVADWASFRRGGPGLDAAAHGDDLRRAAVGVSGPNRAAHRSARRRGPRAPRVAGTPPIDQSAGP